MDQGIAYGSRHVKPTLMTAGMHILKRSGSLVEPLMHAKQALSYSQQYFLTELGCAGMGYLGAAVATAVSGWLACLNLLVYVAFLKVTHLLSGILRVASSWQ